MVKSQIQRQIERSKYAQLAAASGWTSPAKVIVEPKSPEHAVIPIGFYAQSAIAGSFSALDSIATIWNTAPRRFAKISRLDANDNVIVAIDYALIFQSPRDSELRLYPIEVAALENAAIKGAKLCFEIDAILPGSAEWQAVYINYKQGLATESA